MSSRLSLYWNRTYTVPAGFIILFAVVGVVVLLISHAATPYASIEPENGTVTTATTTTDTKASNGSYVQFGTAGSGGGGTGGTTSGGCTSGGVAAPCMNGTNSGTGGSGWTIKFDDEFNTGTTMSTTNIDTTKWDNALWVAGSNTTVGGSNENDCYDASQATEGNGELDLTLVAKSEPCYGGKSYGTGFIQTNGKYSFSYGFTEARIWLPGTNGNIADWPSFWQDGQNWPTDGELDILEGLSGQACGHWHGGPNGDGIGWNVGSGCSSTSYTGGWHTFGADWQPGSVTWYYDGINMGTITSSQASQFGNALAGSPQFLILGLANNNPIVAPATQRNDYVRVWQ